jgi:5'-3' exonuclease
MHASNKKTPVEEQVGLAIHTCMASIAKCWREQNANHVCIMLEGRSWRRDFYPDYKRHRIEARAAQKQEDIDKSNQFFEAFDKLSTFLNEKTNCTVLQNSRLEGDDLIAGWVQNHPNDNHIIISGDTDFVQLLAPNVKQYNGITGELITIEGIFDYRGNRVIDKKTKQPKKLLNPQFELFEKIIRGDTTDNIFSAYPGVREKSSKNKIGLREAFNDVKQGFAWTNLMMQRWVDHNGVEHKVLDDYNRNKTLIDLTAQPSEIRQLIDEVINNAPKHDRPMIGTHFLKFCGKHNLVKLSDQATEFGRILSGG